MVTSRLLMIVFFCIVNKFKISPQTAANADLFSTFAPLSEEWQEKNELNINGDDVFRGRVPCFCIFEDNR